MRVFDLADWYWTVGGDEARAYSSSVRDYVLADNAALVAFKADDNVPILVDTEFNLGLALATITYELAPIPPGIFEGYRSANASSIVFDPSFPVLLDHENRLRAMAGDDPLTAAEFAAKIAGLPPTI